MKRTTDPRLERIRSQERAKERLRTKGLNLPARPDGEVPEVPDDLADLSGPALIEELALHTAWTNYLGTEMVLAEITEETAKTIAERARTDAMLRTQPVKGESVTELKARAGSSSGVREAEDEWLAAKAYRKVLQNVYESSERRASNISREITRRQDRAPHENRTGRWNP